MRSLLAACALVLASVPASAAPFTITLDNVVLSDGGTWEGHFTWNGDNTFDWLLHASGGNTALFPEFTSTPANSLFGFAVETQVSFETPGIPNTERRWTWFTNNVLAGPSPFVAPPVSHEFNAGEFRTIVSGGVIPSGDPESFQAFTEPPPTTSVPEPSSAILFGVGLAAAAARKRLIAPVIQGRSR